MSVFFFVNDPATTEIYTLSLHDALPISTAVHGGLQFGLRQPKFAFRLDGGTQNRKPLSRFGQQRKHVDLHAGDRKSTRLNSSHTVISYAVFCLKKKKKIIINKHQVRKST